MLQVKILEWKTIKKNKLESNNMAFDVQWDTDRTYLQIFKSYSL